MSDINKVNDFSHMGLQWFAEDTPPVAGDAGGKEKEVKEVNFDELVEKNSQAFEKWITNSKIAEKTIGPIKDRAVTQAVKTYETNHLEQKLKDREMQVRAELTKPESPMEKQLKMLADEVLNTKAENERNKAIATAAAYAQQIKLDFGGKITIDELVQGDGSRTVDLLSRIKDVMAEEFEKGKKSFMTKESYTPGASDSTGVPYDGDPRKYAAAIKAGKAVYDQAVYDKINEFIYGKKK
jgi:hypothetical protein